MTLRRVLLLRHGRTSWNAERRFQGQLDPPLDDVGRNQAYEVAALIRALEPDQLVSSDLTRATQTAELVSSATGLPLTIEPRLRERALGHWEGLTRSEVAERYPDEFADWVAARDVSRRGGETRDQVAARALAALADLPEAATTVLVTHGATAMALCTALLGLSQQVHVIVPLANCHWTHLRHEQHEPGESRWLLRSHNVGVPGGVVPLPVAAESIEDASDAEA